MQVILLHSLPNLCTFSSYQGEIKYNASEHASIHEDIRDREFISFGVVLIVWEVLPTFMVVWFFRVRKPNIGDMVRKNVTKSNIPKSSHRIDLYMTITANKLITDY